VELLNDLVKDGEVKIIINEMTKYHQLIASVFSNFTLKPSKRPEPKPVDLEK